MVVPNLKILNDRFKTCKELQLVFKWDGDDAKEELERTKKQLDNEKIGSLQPALHHAKHIVHWER